MELDYILHEKGLISAKECQDIINFFESDEVKRYHFEGFAGDARELNYHRKKDTEILIGFDVLTSMFSGIGKALNIAFKKYREQYPHIDDLPQWMLEGECKVQRYNPGEGYTMLHWENDGPDSSSSRRVLGWTIYLNDVYDGGQTEFPYQNKQIQPRTGDLIIFPAGWTHAHRGIVSKTELKYIVTGWNVFKYLRIHQRNTY